MVSLFFSLNSHLSSVGNLYLSDVIFCQCANCVDGILMFNLIQFYVHLLESRTSVGTFQKACWDWDLLHIRMETRPRLKLLTWKCTSPSFDWILAELIHGLNSSAGVSAWLQHFIQLDDWVWIITGKIKHKARVYVPACMWPAGSNHLRC